MSTVAVTDMTQDEAREFIAYVRNQQRELPRRIQDAWRRRAWAALGYQSWDAMCVGERIQLRGLPRDDRQGMVLELRTAGMSMPAIASAVGTSVGTIHTDLSELKGRGEETPETITSLDGRQRPASRPAPDRDPDYWWTCSQCAHQWRKEPWKYRCPKCNGAPAVPDDGEPEPDPLPAPIAEQIGQRITQQRQPEPEVWTEEETALREQLENGQTVVVSQRGHHNRLIAWAAENQLYRRIDRTTEWGNPFETPADGDRAAVIANYRDHYLPHKPSLDRKRDLLTGKALGCWCAPDPCHGDVLAAWADSRSA